MKKVKEQEQHESWVVYLMTLHGKPDGLMAVCSQDDWDAIEVLNPGRNTLIQSGIENEGVAERLARGTSGNPPPRKCLPR